MTDTNLVHQMFETQLELVERFDEIERENGFLVPKPPYNIDDPHVQHRIKVVCQRTCEELAEAMLHRGELGVAIDRVPNTSIFEMAKAKISVAEKFIEEMIDSLHFLIEMSMIGGFESVQVGRCHWVWKGEKKSFTSMYEGSDPRIKAISKNCAEAILRLHLACHELKNKPWKQKLKPTDRVQFEYLMAEAWAWIGECFVEAGMTLDEVSQVYHVKRMVNHGRITQGS